MRTHIFGAALVAVVTALVAATPATAQRISDKSGVKFADPNEKIDGPKAIAGKTSFVSPLPFFKDLKPWDPNYKAPRAADGHADLQGVWSTASLTTMTRGGGRGGSNGVTTLVIPPEKVAEATGGAYYTKARDDSQKRTDPNSGVFTDKDADAGYNAFWIDPGSEYAKVDTEYRSSWIVDPPSGQIPYNAGGNRAVGARMNAATTINNTGPEIRGYGDRCLISFGNQGGPPLTNAMYNNNIQLTQTADYVVLDIEMNHDARIIRIAKPGEQVSAKPANIRQWFGDSVGHWQGDTLVVETRNLHPMQARGRVPLSDKGVVTERFRRVSDVEIDYQFEVNDPTNYSQVWKGQMPLRQSKERIFEYACHEGNYALPGILRGMAEGRDTAIRQEGE
jgi:hypothetical protein